MLIAVVAAVLAASLAGLGFVVQQRVASSQPHGDALHLRLLLHLARRPMWLLGVGSMVLGQVLGATALSSGGLGLVEPLLATNLLFALGIAAAWRRTRLVRREWVGAVLVAGGLGGFVAAGRPGGGTIRLPWPSWAISIGTVILVVLLLVLRARGRPPMAAARTIGAAAGVMFGLQDALTRRVLAVLPHGGVAAMLTQWPTYLLVAVGVASLLLSQSAFEEGTLPAALPPMTFGEPVTGIAFGAGVYSEHLSLAPGPLVAEVLCLAAAGAGVWMVAAAPTLGQGHLASAAATYPPADGSREPAPRAASALAARNRDVR